jgi:hypothetical protein
LKIYKHILKEKQSENINLTPSYNRRGTNVTTQVTNKSISQVTQNFQANKIQTDKKINRSMTFDNLGCVNIDFDVFKNLEGLAFSSTSTNKDSFNTILIDPILSKNIDCVDDVLKFMFVGDQCVGKTYMINKLLDDTALRQSYTHTNSFEIKKKNIKLLEKRIKLEFWDTNVDIMSSEICKGEKL